MHAMPVYMVLVRSTGMPSAFMDKVVVPALCIGRNDGLVEVGRDLPWPRAEFAKAVLATADDQADLVRTLQDTWHQQADADATLDLLSDSPARMSRNIRRLVARMDPSEITSATGTVAFPLGDERGFALARRFIRHITLRRPWQFLR